uniref:Uncharacterized protein n=1 Tax=viral metagenome TaxID=1070528 RepID=A0A6M3LQ44_9ZZZZ
MEIHGKQFDVVMKSRGNWQTEYRNAIATKGNSKAEATQSLKDYDPNKLISACDSHDQTVERDVYFKAHTGEFQAVFGFAPPRDFLLYACGYGLSLDVIQLDKKLHTPDGISTNDYILKTYGESAVNMVKRMI